MSIRNLLHMLNPASVAIIETQQGSPAVSAAVVRNLLHSGFKGEIVSVLASGRTIEGISDYPTVASLPMVPELAIINAALTSLPGLVSEFAMRGTKAVIVMGGRNDAIGKEQTQELHRAMLEAAEPQLLRILGPDSLGIMAPRAGINASLGDVQPLAGSLALVAQSGAALTPVLEWASARGIGFSYVVSLGEMVDVDFGDMLDFLAGDPDTRAILLFIETLKQVRKFLSAARAATRTKPVIALKSGRFQDISWCSTSPLVDLAGTANLYEAIFWRAGIVQVFQLEDLFDAVQTLHTVRSVAGDRLAIVTNGGGIGWLAADALCDAGGRMANLSPDSIERLTPMVPPEWSPGEPIDLGSNAQGCHYIDALEILLNDRGLDAVFALHSPNALSPNTETAQAVVAMVQKRAVRSNAPVVFTAWLGEASDSTARQLFAKHHIPSYDTPDRAVRGMMQIVRYRRHQETLMQTVPPLPDNSAPDTGKAREIIDQAITEGRAWLTGPETKGVLAAYGIPVVPAQTAATPEEAAAIAKALKQPVALKILSPDILQKSVAGGVLLSLENPLQVKEAAAAMLEDVGKKAPHARLLGFTIEPMMRLEASHELMLAMLQEAHVGPVILFGHGGTAFNLIQDGILGLPPLDLHLARQLIKRTRIGRLLEGASGMPAADMESIALVLVKISQLVCDLDSITELNINPLLAWAQGVVAVDAWMKVAGAARPAAERLAIRPYPKELEEAIKLPDGHTILLRPIRPEDEPLYAELFANLTLEEVFLRFLNRMKTLSHNLAARLTQLDYDRDMALVLIGQRPSGEPELYGGARIMADSDNERAEFAILLRHDMTGLGLGPLLLRRIIDYARVRGVVEIYGEVLSENRAMLKLCQVFGYTAKRSLDDPGLVNVSLRL